MIETPQVIQTAAHLAAIIHLTIARSEVQTVMGPAISEVMAAVMAQGLEPAGPWFTHHLKMDPEKFDFQVCVPISTPVAAVGRVVCATMPGARVARTIHQGPYDGTDGLAAAWSEFGKWIATNGHVTGPDLYECYLTGPESGSGPEDWRTELSRPLIK
ncbi:MAG TPA: GyrI-like domain-containing protein [Bryobacteraceae bacterium]|jgi:effector-binding domain-containing protein|nr:GyrI-like domain-containing protein [Bryobacteraceae bacterium]